MEDDIIDIVLKLIIGVCLGLLVVALIMLPFAISSFNDFSAKCMAAGGIVISGQHVTTRCIKQDSVINIKEDEE